MEIRSSWGGEALLDKYYPIGRIYQSTENVSPAAFMGGSWEQIKDVFLLCAGDTYAAGTTGGNAMHTNTVEEMATHNHQYSVSGINGIMGNYGDRETYTTSGLYCPTDYRLMVKDSGTIYAGGGQPFSIMPPYLAVYCWRRVA